MEDREMLELAAKAYGLRIAEGPWCNPSYFDGTWLVCEVPKWDPRGNLDYALRLAVRLKMKVTVGNAIVMVEHPSIPDVGVQFTDDYVADVMATCLAITLAAAEIGKAIP